MKNENSELDQLRIALHNLAQLLIDADHIARQRGDKHGLCDSIDNSGGAYPSASASASAIVSQLKREGYEPVITIEQALRHDYQIERFERLQ